MPKKLVLFLSGVSLFLVFIFFSYLVHKNLFTQLDFNTTVHLQDDISRRFDGIFSFLSDIGKFEVMLIVLIAFFAITRKWLAGLVAFALFGGFHLIELYGKFFVNHPPPPHFMLRTENIVNFPQFYVSSDFSYPSGHAGRAAFLATIFLIFLATNKKLSLRVKVILTAAIIGYDVVMCVSRVYLGEHWTTDVIGGTILGSAFGMIAATVLLIEKKKKQSA